MLSYTARSVSFFFTLSADYLSIPDYVPHCRVAACFFAIPTALCYALATYFPSAFRSLCSVCGSSLIVLVNKSLDATYVVLLLLRARVTHMSMTNRTLGRQPIPLNLPYYGSIATTSLAIQSV